MNRSINNSVRALALCLCLGMLPAVAFAQVDPNASVESLVRSYFADTPSMIAIAKCESGFRQFEGDGSVLFDPNYSMVGIFQESVAHMPEALGLGMDITTVNGNLGYAKYLYQQNGVDPWMDSYGCWGSSTSAQTTPVTTTVTVPTTTSITTATGSTLAAANILTTMTAPVSQPIPSVGSVLSLGMTSSVIQTLQQMLNQAGFVIAASGAGSPGQETTRFGALTREAVRRFQCSKGIVCSGDESTTGYGMVDARTYAALVAAQPIATAVPPVSPAPTSNLQPTPATPSSLDKAAQIAQVESQIAAMVQQLDGLNQRLSELTK